MSTQKKAVLVTRFWFSITICKLFPRCELGLVMHGAFCDLPWPGQDAGDDPGLSRTVGSGDTRRTRRTPCACPMFCFVALLPAIRELIFQYFAEQEKIQQNAT